MSTIKNVQVGDLLSTEQNEMWLVVEKNKNKKLPDLRWDQLIRSCRTDRNDNRNWKWDQVKLRCLNGQHDYVDREIVCYWDPRKEKENEVAMRRLNTDRYNYWDRKTQLFTQQELEAKRKTISSREERMKVLNEVADYCVPLMNEVVKDGSRIDHYSPPFRLLQRVVASPEFQEKFPFLKWTEKLIIHSTHSSRLDEDKFPVTDVITQNYEWDSEGDFYYFKVETIAEGYGSMWRHVVWFQLVF